MSGAVRVLMLSWEYPPLLVGGLGRHVEALATALAAAGHDVCVVTRGSSDEVVDEQRSGVRVVRSAVDPLAIDFTTESLLAWALAFEHSLLRAALPLLRDWRPDVVHAHDWLVAQAATTLAQAAGRPLVATIHATEGGRHQGWLPRPLNLAIHSVERWLAHTADEVITCSATMRTEVAELLELDAAAVHIVPNGIDADRWSVPARPRSAMRARMAPDGPLVAFAGRLVHEKGVQTIITALGELRRDHPGLRLVVAGTGGYGEQLRELARRRHVARAVEWLGFVADEDLPVVLACADVAVVPSLYEPFGIVALEVAATGTPLAVAQTGGLRDLIERGVAAASFPAGDAAALAQAVGRVLVDPPAARTAARKAARLVRREFSWPAVAARTADIYRAAAEA